MVVQSTCGISLPLQILAKRCNTRCDGEESGADEEEEEEEEEEGRFAKSCKPQPPMRSQPILSNPPLPPIFLLSSSSPTKCKLQRPKQWCGWWEWLTGDDGDNDNDSDGDGGNDDDYAADDDDHDDDGGDDDRDDDGGDSLNKEAGEKWLSRDRECECTVNRLSSSSSSSQIIIIIIFVINTIITIIIAVVLCITNDIAFL